MSKKRSPASQLQQLFPAPSNPTEAGPIDLRASLEEKLGLKLPDDIYEFGLTYGTGWFGTACFSGLLQICNPFSPLFLGRIDGLASMFHEIKKAEGESYIPYKIYPERQGLLPFGFDEAGRFLLWLTKGRPNKWPILVWPPEREFKQIDATLTNFLLGLLTGEIDCWGGDMTADWFKANQQNITFTPIMRKRKRKNRE